MHKWNRRVVRILVVIAALGAVCFGIARYSTHDVGVASQCANTACNDTCWADGTHENHGTEAVQKFPSQNCGIGQAECITRACH